MLPHSALRTPHSALRTPHSADRSGRLPLALAALGLIAMTGAGNPVFAQPDTDPGGPGTTGGIHMFSMVEVGDWEEDGFLGWTLEEVVAVNYTPQVVNSETGVTITYGCLEVVVNLRDANDNVCAFYRRTNQDARSTADALWYRIRDTANNLDYTRAHDMNVHGIVVGEAINSLTGVIEGFDWEYASGTPAYTRHLHTLEQGGKVFGVNDAGDMCGFHAIDGHPMGFSNASQQWQGLPGNQNWTEDGAFAISNRFGPVATPDVWIMGQGHYETSGLPSDWFTAVWKVPTSGLSDEVAPLSPDGSILGVPYSVNSAGLGVGGALRGTAWTPCLWGPDANKGNAPAVYRELIAADFPYAASTYFDDGVVAEVNAQNEFVMSTGLLGAWNGTDILTEDPFLLAVHRHVNYPWDTVDGSLELWAIDDEGVMAGSVALVANPSIRVPVVVFPHDANANGTSDFRDVHDDVTYTPGLWGNDWYLPYLRQFRSGMYGVGDVSNNDIGELKPHCDLVRIHADVSQAQVQFGPAGVIDNAINTFGLGADATEVLLLFFDPEDTSQLGDPFDKLNLDRANPDDAATLETFRCLGNDLAFGVDYIQLGNEPYGHGPGGLYFPANSIPGHSAFAGTFKTILDAQPEDIALVTAALEFSHEWFARKAQAVREGSCLAGRPIRIVTASPTLGNITPAIIAVPTGDPNGTGRPEWQDSGGAMILYYTFVEAAKWADISDIHLHWDGSEDLQTGNLGVRMVVDDLFENWLFDRSDPPNNPNNWLNTENAFPELIGCTEYGAKTNEDWRDEYEAQLESFYTGTPVSYDFVGWLDTTWINNGSAGLRPDRADFPDNLDMGIEDILKGFRRQGQTNVPHFAYGLYGGVITPGDGMLEFVPPALQQVDMNPLCFPGNQLQWSTKVKKQFEDWSNWAISQLVDPIDPDHTRVSDTFTCP